MTWAVCELHMLAAAGNAFAPVRYGERLPMFPDEAAQRYCEMRDASARQASQAAS